MSIAPTSSNGNSNALTSSNGNINAITSSNSFRTRTALTLNSRNNIAIHFFEALLLEGIVTAPVESELTPPKNQSGILIMFNNIFDGHASFVAILGTSFCLSWFCCFTENKEKL